MSSERGVIAWMANNPVAANLLMLVVMVGGLAATGSMTKEVFPTFPTEMITITVPYPGSSPEEVEAGIVRIIEEEILDIVGVEEISSVSREGVGTVTVQMEAGTSMSRALVELKGKVDGIASFPAGAEEPVVSEVLARTRAMFLSVYGDLDEYQLKELADTVRTEVLQIPGISQVSTRGARDYEISIEVSDTALRSYSLSFDDVVNAIRLRSEDLPGGKLRTAGGSISLRSMGQAYTADEFSRLNLITRSDGTVLTVGDVAAVRDTFEEQPVLTRFNGKPSVSLEVDRVGDQNALAMTENLRAYVATKRQELPPGVELTTWADRSEILKGRINLMLKSAVQGSILVLITLALFLNTSLALWVILGVPFSFLGALLVLGTFEIVTINILSVFGFILVLGMLVDDGIVTAESAFAQLEDEDDGVDSIVRGVRRVTVATIFGALTTMIAFAPTAFLTEGIGRLLSAIVPVVLLSLLFSLLETKLILPAHLRHIRIETAGQPSRTPLGLLKTLQQACSGGLLRFSENVYRPILSRAIEYRYITLALFLGILLISTALIPAGIVRFVFFPNVPSDSIRVELKMPSGTPWQKTHEYSTRIETAVEAMNRRYIEETGIEKGVIRETLVLSTTDTESQVIVELTPSEQRDISSVELVTWIRESLGTLVGAQSLLIDANAGPGGAAIDIEISGEKLEDMRSAAEELKQALLEFDGVADIRDTFDAGGPELDIQITAQGEALGLSQVELARQVRQAFFGAEVQRVQRGIHEVRVYVRLPAEHRKSLDALRQLWIDVPGRGKIPFDVVGQAVQLTGISEINRFDRQRVVNIRADIDKSRVEPGEVNDDIVRNVLPDILQHYHGLEYRMAGAAEEQAETTNSLGLGFFAILIMIYAAVAIPLRSYGLPLIIMAVIPFGLTGAILGHLILGSALSMLSVIGMIGLTGIVVNDSLVLVDHINHRLGNRDENWEDAVVNGSVRRFRPVILTSITTFMGLLPIQLETAIQAQFVKPMAVSVGFGVLFATFVTLLLVPVLYFVGRDIKDWAVAPRSA